MPTHQSTNTTALEADALQPAGCHRIYQDTTRGKFGVASPQFEEYLADLHKGAIFVVWQLDRIGRSLLDFVRIGIKLVERADGFDSQIDLIETTNASGKLRFHLFAELAEFERNLIRERIKTSLTAACTHGGVGSRKPKLNAKQFRHIKALRSDPKTSVTELVAITGCRERQPPSTAVLAN